MSIDSRLSRLAPALTAQERAILVLESWKDGRQEDPAWRKHMPTDQSHAFNRYIEQMNQANVVLGRLTGTLYLQAEKVELRFHWLLTLELWQEHIDEMRRAVGLSVSEPITQSEYDRKLAARRDEWAPVEDIAAFLAGYHEWPDADYEGADDGRWLNDAAWDRTVAEEEQKLRSMARRGELPSRGKGKAMQLQERAIEHFGHAVGVGPEDFLSFRVVPDDQAEEVETDRKALKYLRSVVSWRHDDDPDDFSSWPSKIRAGLRETTAFQLVSVWVQLRCVDTVVAEIGDSFNGIHPLRPMFREKLEATREKLLSLKDWFAVIRVEVELREPLEEELQEMRDFLASIPATP